MYLSVMPESHDPPPALAHSISYESTNDDVFLPPQWVIARGRSIRRKKRKFDEQLQLTAASGGDSDAELLSDQPERPLSPGRQVLLFFRVGTNWKDLAWVLFDGVQSDTETVRMIKDIQLKQPGKLTEQVRLGKSYCLDKGSDHYFSSIKGGMILFFRGRPELSSFSRAYRAYSFL